MVKIEKKIVRTEYLKKNNENRIRAWSKDYRSIAYISYSFLLFKDMTGEQADLSHRITAERYDTFA